MENAMDWDKNTLVNELAQGRNLAKELQIHLNPFASKETRELLAEKILCSFEKALSMLQWSGPEINLPVVGPNVSGISESPHSVAGSPWREESEQDHGDISKKRKMLPRWTEQVRIMSETGGELEDGYSWRKYGQKDILGAKHPRGYYRCTYRNVQDCLATKQVQRSDDDPTIFEITYRGKHTCIQASHLTPATTPAPALAPARAPATVSSQKQKKQNPKHSQQQQQQQSNEILFNFRTGLKVKTEDLDTQELKSSSYFTFPSSSIDFINIDNHHIFSPTAIDNNFMGTFSPSFISPATSDSNYFSVSSSRINSFGGAQNFQTSESDPTEIISATTSVTNSPIPEIDFTLDPSDFDADFPFESLGFLPKFDEM